MSDKFKEYSKPKKNDIDLDKGVTIKGKYRIMRWKLLKDLRDLILRDFDKFTSEAGENDQLIDLVLSGAGYEFIFDEKSNKLKFGLEDSKIWKRMKEQMDNNFHIWYEEYESWLKPYK